jgi:predicted Zn-dependent peptidase
VRGLRLAALLACAVGLAQADDGEVRLPPLERVTFDNGLRVIVGEDHELPLVQVYLLVGAGASQDAPGKGGLATLTAATLTRGAGERSAEELARAIESLGGAITASAGRDGTIVDAEFLAEDLGAGLGLLQDVVLRPRFEEDEVRRARDEQLAAIRAARENPSNVVAECFDAWLYGDHPYGRPAIGRPTSVQALGQADVRGFYERWYRPNNTILVLIGDVTRADAVARLKTSYGSWEGRPDAVPARPPVPPSVAKPRLLLVDDPASTQTQIRFGNIAMPRANPARMPASVGNTILGGGFTSRLVEELRVKRSLTYGAWSQFDMRLTTGSFQIGTFTKSATTLETLQLAVEVLQKFRAGGPTPEELTKARAYLRGQFPLALETAEAIAARLAEIEFYGLPQDDLTTYRTRVAAVTDAQVKSTAEQWMPPAEHLAIAVVGKASEIREPLEGAYGELRVLTAEACASLTEPVR